MGLNPLSPRLRVINRSNDVAKVDLVIAPGDELEVSADVADQLAATPAIKPVDWEPTVAEPTAVEADPVEDEALVDASTETADDDAKPAKAPAKKTAKKAPAKRAK